MEEFELGFDFLIPNPLILSHIPHASGAFLFLFFYIELVGELSL